jgi:hypothetical protein
LLTTAPFRSPGIQLVMKGLQDKIRNKGESHFVEKFEKLKPLRGKSSQLKYRARTTVASAKKMCRKLFERAL